MPKAMIMRIGLQGEFELSGHDYITDKVGCTDFPRIDLAGKFASSAFFLPNSQIQAKNMAGVIRHFRPTLRLFAKANATASARTYADASTKEMPLTFASANQVFYDEVDVKQVDVPTFSGVMGILPKHVPTLAVLSPGIVTVFEKEGNAKKIFVSSGTLCVNEDASVQVLAEEAHNVEDLDATAAKESLMKAQSDLSAAPAEKKGEAAIAVEVAESIVRALG